MTPPPPATFKLSGIAIKVLSAYKHWNSIQRHIPKMRRYSLGIRVDNLFAEIIENTSEAQFSPVEERARIITKAITKNDTLKFMIFALLELDAINNNDFAELSLPLEEVGRMLYGWKNRSLTNKSQSERKQ